MNEEFEEWLEVFAGNEEFDVEFVAREAYKLGLQRGFDTATSRTTYVEVEKELQVLNSEAESDEAVFLGGRQPGID